MLTSFLDAGPPPVTAGTLGQIAFACVVASCTAYTCRQKLRVGNGIQGFIVGYIVAMWTTNLWIGGMTQNVDTTWLVFGIQLLFGAGLGAGCCRRLRLLRDDVHRLLVGGGGAGWG